MYYLREPSKRSNQLHKPYLHDCQGKVLFGKLQNEIKSHLYQKIKFLCHFQCSTAIFWVVCEPFQLQTARIN